MTMGQSELAAQARVRDEALLPQEPLKKWPHSRFWSVCLFSHLSAPLCAVSSSHAAELTVSVGAVGPSG